MTLKTPSNTCYLDSSLEGPSLSARHPGLVPSPSLPSDESGPSEQGWVTMTILSRCLARQRELGTIWGLF